MRAKLAVGQEFFDQDMNTSEGFGEGFVADLLAIDADAFVDFFKGGGGIQTRSDASAAQDAFEERGSGAFAVGAGDVGARRSAVGATEALGEGSDVFQIELCGGALGRRDECPAERKVMAGG